MAIAPGDWIAQSKIQNPKWNEGVANGKTNFTPKIGDWAIRNLIAKNYCLNNWVSLFSAFSATPLFDKIT
ncbi:hypothetical protein [Nostoc sp.]|uniref:hypothetical protein n=1 Tax=Nostoc sp. TaxID=1180 RepID=UPI002FFAB9F7